MRILFLSQIIPYPLNSGPRVKTWHVLRFLREQGHEVVLAAFARPDEFAHIGAVRPFCSAVHAVPLQRSRLTDFGHWLSSHFVGVPFLVRRDRRTAMHELIQGLLNREPVDAIHADQLPMAQYALNGTFSDKGHTAQPLRVFDAHNAIWSVMERMRAATPKWERPFLGAETRRLQSYEAKVVNVFDLTVAVSEADREALIQAAALSASTLHASAAHHLSDRVMVVPIGIDTAMWRPVRRSSSSTSILAVGTLYYPPNADGIHWFAHEVFPEVCRAIPEAKLTIVGKNPPRRLRGLANRKPESIKVTGYVQELRPYLESSALMVVPVRAGGGMRVRILEGFARGIPMVTTTLGLEGIEAQPGRDILVADTASDFASAVVRLLGDGALQKRLASNGRRIAERLYDWQVALKPLAQVYA